MKRVFDLLFSIIFLITFSPVYVLLAGLVVWRLGSPVLFSQVRPGRDERPFKMWKFRTMLDSRDAVGELLSDELRLTTFGKFLRATSLDELPEMWNVVLGEMSLVGPRPLLEEYLPLYTERQRRRHQVRPGITGLAQISGRNGLKWVDRLELDVQYVEKMSFWLDLKILFLTVFKVVNRDGITEKGKATMSKFRAES